MARKKNRPSQASPGTATAGSATAITTAPAKPPVPAPKSPAAEADFRSTPTGRFFVQLFRVFSSLQLAIVLLSIFTSSLILATLLESWYSTKVAQDMVYRTKWFALLLVLLATTILCAALKKYPWKRYQTGFLITHTGLLILVFGGLLTALAGTEGLMNLVDTDKPELQRQIGIENTSSTIAFPDEQTIEVWRARRSVIGDEADAEFVARLIARNWDFRRAGLANEREGVTLMRLLAYGLKKTKGVDVDPKDFAAMSKHVHGSEDLRDLVRAAALEDQGQQMLLNPGPFTWYVDDYGRPQLPPVLAVLNAVASPWPGFSERLDAGTSFTIRNFYSHTERAPYSEAPPGHRGFPAFKISFTSPNTGPVPAEWVAGIRGGEYLLNNIALVECLVLRDQSLLPEFLNPPPPEQMGKQGQLALVIGDKTFRVPVDKAALGESRPLGDTGLRVTLKSYADSLFDAKADGPEYPTVGFELAGPAGKADYEVVARMPQVNHVQGNVGRPVAVWYHHPDFRWGNSHLMGTLQFLQTADGLYFRVFGKGGFQESGVIDLQKLDDPEQFYPAWKTMNFRFRVGDYLPHALEQTRYIPRNVRPGTTQEDRPDLAPAIRCELEHTGKKREFWLSLHSTRPEKVEVGGDWYFFRYGMHTQALDCQVTLKRAKQVSDPGTQRAASFSSDVVLAFTRGGKKQQEDHHIWMNHPMEYGGFKFYQSGYRLLGPDPADDRPISRSTLQVASDPGLWFKYTGSLTVVLGIVVMFYMKAYFFKPRGGRPLAAEDPQVT
jgi:ResB-like family